MGPGRNSNSSARWFQIDEPVTSVGSRSGVNWTRENPRPVTLANGPGGQRLCEPGDVLEQHVAVRQEAGEHELEPVALADDGTLDLIEHDGRTGGELAQLHASRSRSSTARSTVSSGIPDAVRSSGGGRSGRMSSQTVGPTSASARSGARSRSTPRRKSSPEAIDRSVGRSR